jgi:thiol-disulfide isomerase/thioredoxin
MIFKKSKPYSRFIPAGLLGAIFFMWLSGCAPAKKTVVKPKRKSALKTVKAKKSRSTPKNIKRPKILFREGTEVKVGSDAPTISAMSIDGKEISTADCTGRVILLNFWSIRCGPCIKEMPYLEKLYEEFGPSGLDVYSVNTDQASVKEVREFIDSRPFDLTYDVVADPDLVLTTVFTKWFVPVTILIDSKGIMRYNNTGFAKRDYGKYRKIIRNIINGEKVTGRKSRDHRRKGCISGEECRNSEKEC